MLPGYAGYSWYAGYAGYALAIRVRVPALGHMAPSWVKHVPLAYRHNTRMGLWGGVRHPLFFWPVWRHILGVPCVFHPTPTCDGGAGSARAPLLGLVALSKVIVLGCALQTGSRGGSWGSWGGVEGKATVWNAPFTPQALGVDGPVTFTSHQLRKLQMMLMANDVGLGRCMC